MWFKHRGWIPAAWLSSVGNLAGLWFAAGAGEAWHATGHGALAVLFGLGARHLMMRHRGEPLHAQLQQVLDENERLQETTDAMHGRLQELEERVDFSERLLAQHRDGQRVDAPSR